MLWYVTHVEAPTTIILNMMPGWLLLSRCYKSHTSYNICLAIDMSKLKNAHYFSRRSQKKKAESRQPLGFRYSIGVECTSSWINSSVMDVLNLNSMINGRIR